MRLFLFKKKINKINQKIKKSKNQKISKITLFLKISSSTEG